MSFEDIVQQIRPAVVGLGILTDPADPLSVVIVGTGFFLHPDGWIMTNRHVVESFLANREGHIGIRNALARAVIFVDARGRELPGGARAVGGIGLIACPIVEAAMPPAQVDEGLHHLAAPDLAVCRIDARELNRLTLIRHLQLANSDTVREGESVGVAGFPLGLKIPRDNRLRQMTPIVQRGIIAAVLPFPGIPNPHAFQLDIHINPGSSGSPLFRTETGEVVGVVFAAPIRHEQVAVQTPDGEREVAIVAVPTGFGYAVPSNRYNREVQPGRGR